MNFPDAPAVSPDPDRFADRKSTAECAAIDALEVADLVVGRYDPTRTDPAHDALRAACFGAVLADLLAMTRT